MDELMRHFHYTHNLMILKFLYSLHLTKLMFLGINEQILYLFLKYQKVQMDLNQKDGIPYI